MVNAVDVNRVKGKTTTFTHINQSEIITSRTIAHNIHEYAVDCDTKHIPEIAHALKFEISQLFHAVVSNLAVLSNRMRSTTMTRHFDNDDHVYMAAL